MFILSGTPVAMTLNNSFAAVVWLIDNKKINAMSRFICHPWHKFDFQKLYFDLDYIAKKINVYPYTQPGLSLHFTKKSTRIILCHPAAKNSKKNRYSHFYRVSKMK